MIIIVIRDPINIGGINFKSDKNKKAPSKLN